MKIHTVKKSLILWGIINVITVIILSDTFTILQLVLKELLSAGSSGEYYIRYPGFLNILLPQAIVGIFLINLLCLILWQIFVKTKLYYAMSLFIMWILVSSFLSHLISYQLYLGVINNVRNTIYKNALLRGDILRFKVQRCSVSDQIQSDVFKTDNPAERNSIECSFKFYNLGKINFTQAPASEINLVEGISIYIAPDYRKISMGDFSNGEYRFDFPFPIKTQGDELILSGRTFTIRLNPDIFYVYKIEFNRGGKPFIKKNVNIPLNIYIGK